MTKVLTSDTQVMTYVILWVEEYFVKILWKYYLSNDSSHDLCYDLSHDLSHFFCNIPNPKKIKLMSDGSCVSYNYDSF